MKRAMIAVIGVVTAMVLMVGMSSVSRAETLASSAFTSGDEGWRLVDWNGSGTPIVPSWYGAGGNPDGYIASADVFGDGFFKAPDSYHGDLSVAYGGSLSYDAFASLSGWVMTDIYLVGNGITISNRFPTNPSETWTHFSAPLSAGTWMQGVLYQEMGPLATEDDIKSVLSNVTDIRIRQEYHFGADWSGIDNVVLSGVVPEPSTLVLLGVSALGFLGGVWRRRRS